MKGVERCHIARFCMNAVDVNAAPSNRHRLAGHMGKSFYEDLYFDS